MNKRQRRKMRKKYGLFSHLFRRDDRFYGAIAGPRKDKKKDWLYWIEGIVSLRDMRISLKLEFTRWNH